MDKLITLAGVVFGAAVWILLFVILGVALGTAYIAGGSVLAAACSNRVTAGRVRDAPLTTAGPLLGLATFVILEVVLSSIPMWLPVVSGLGVIGLCGIADVRPRGAESRLEAEAAQESSRPAPDRSYANGHRSNGRDLVGTR